MPAIHGRVCYHPCETQCNREQHDSSVSIHAVERFLGDMAIAEGWQIKVDKESSGKRILIIGAGPSGLSAAYHLAHLGHKVIIYEAGPMDHYWGVNSHNEGTNRLGLIMMKLREQLKNGDEKVNYAINMVG